jgi:group I intron endonuclease
VTVIYVITHTATCRHYVGKTRNLQRRWHNHLSLARRADRTDAAHKIHCAMHEYGPGAFGLRVLEELDDDDAADAEVWWIGYLRSNIDGFGFNVLIGRAHTEETRAKIGDAHRGRRYGPDVRERMSMAAKRRSPPSSEARARMSAANRGRKMPLDGIARRAARALGISPEEWLERRRSGMLWCSLGRHWVAKGAVRSGNCRPCERAYNKSRRAGETR